ncbi:MAG: NADH-quinone oxidoreductase subunit NuoN [Rickettsiales bacterium]|nr:NADH-quinone oxidoreductase subunit NuoN [Rickettsiales bacterium]
MSADFILQVQGLLPEIFLAISTLILLMAGVYGGNTVSYIIHFFAALVLLVTLHLSTLITGWGIPSLTFIHDAFALYGKIFVLFGATATLLISSFWLSRAENNRFEFPILILFCTLGMMLMLSAGDMLIVYLGLELAALSQYVLAAFQRDRARSTEAGLKYFVLGSLASGMLLFGISLIYGYTGSIEFAGISSVIAGYQEQTQHTSQPMPYGLVLGMVMVLVGFCFKISAAPFHMWSPDVYEGSPTPVTAFFSIAPKVASVMLLMRLLAVPFGGLAEQWQQIILAISALSMIVGALGALKQTNIKRLLAYSSIGHVGYALMALATNTKAGFGAVLVYLGLYVFMSLGAFALVMLMRRKGEYVESLSDLTGISRFHPWFAFAMAVFMFSMAGIPPLAGFFAKLYVFLEAVRAGYLWLAILGVLSSVVAAYYYIRLIKLMYFDEGGEAFEFPVSPALRLVSGMSALVMLLFILAPATLVKPALIAASALIP